MDIGQPLKHYLRVLVDMDEDTEEEDEDTEPEEVEGAEEAMDVVDMEDAVDGTEENEFLPLMVSTVEKVIGKLCLLWKRTLVK